MSFKRGDIIRVMCHNSNGWYKHNTVIVLEKINNHRYKCLYNNKKIIIKKVIDGYVEIKK